MARTEEQKLKWNAYMRLYNKKNYNREKESDRQSKKYAKSRDEYFSVYYLPEEHYVGMTNNIKNRMKDHRCSGKFIDDFEILATFEKQVDAHLFETLLHSMDYNGFFVGNTKQKNK
jgi:hypothetical protein